MRFLTYIIVLFFFISCNGQHAAIANLEKAKNNQELASLEQTVVQVLKFYNDKNQKEFSKFINPQIGLYFLYRPGTVDYWQNTDKICFDANCLNELNIPQWGKEALEKQKLDLKSKLQKTQEEIVGCESVLKNGLFAEEAANTKHLLSETMKKYAEAFKADLSSKDSAKLKQEQEKVQKWENNSRRIVVAQKKDKTSKGEAFVFYLTEIDGRWYVTIIDYISFDCSV